MKFQLPDGQSADVLANSIEGFPVRTPEDFLAFLRAQLPDPVTGQPAPDAVPRFLDGHPTARAFIERLMQKPVPASYGQVSYHAEHAFLLTAVDGMSRFGRYRWMPEAGEAYLSPDEASQRSVNFLRQELESRLRNGPVVFRHCQLKETALKTIPLSLRFLACMGPCIPLLAKKVLVRALSFPPGPEISALLALS